MDKKKLMLLLGAIIVALGSAVAVRAMMSGHTAPALATAILAPSGPRVLVAQRALPMGTIVTADAVAYQTWPRDMVQDAYFIDGKTDKAKLIGTVVRNTITAGQPLTQGALVAPGDHGFMAAALNPGMRAITIPVSDMSGVAGFIFPGDHVDMMLTQTVKTNDPLNANALPLSLTETVLRDLRVLATDQSPATEVTPTGQSIAKTAHNVTLEVTPRVAERIQVAQTLGTLSLTLRPLADSQDEPDRSVGKMARGMAGATSYSTGGDVSRFARRTLPAAGPSRRNALPTAPTVKVARGNSLSVQPIGTNPAALPSPPAGMQPLQRAVGGE